MGIMFLFMGNSQRCFYYATQSDSDWLFITQSCILQDDWLMSENNGEGDFHINMPKVEYRQLDYISKCIRTLLELGGRCCRFD